MNSFCNVKFFWEVFATLLVITDPALAALVALGQQSGCEQDRLSRTGASEEGGSAWKRG